MGLKVMISDLIWNYMLSVQAPAFNQILSIVKKTMQYFDKINMYFNFQFILKQSFKLLTKQVFDCLSLCFTKRNFTPLQFFQGDYCKVCDVSVSFPPVLSNSVFIQCAGSYWDWITRSARAGHQILCYLWISREELSIVKHVNFKVIK